MLAPLAGGPVTTWMTIPAVTASTRKPATEVPTTGRRSCRGTEASHGRHCRFTRGPKRRVSR